MSVAAENNSRRDQAEVDGTDAPLRPVRILIATIADLPEGGGRTSRLKTLAGCLVRQGHAVRIWSKYVLGQFPPEWMALRGAVEGAPFEIISGSTARIPGVRSLFMKVCTTAKMAARLWRERRAVDVLWLNELSFHDMWPLMAVARLAGINVVLSYEDEHVSLCTEWPLHFRQRWFTGLDDRLADRFLVRRADAVVVISTYLRDKFAALGARNLVIVPTIVDVDRWHCAPKVRAGRLRFLYAGSLQGTYVLEEIVSALGRLKAEVLDFELHVFGDIQKGALMPSLRNLRDELGLQAHMVFANFLTLEELRREIAQADILLCIRKDTRRSRSGLSTKLSECLATGRPTVTSRVGDAPLYLKDRESVLFVPSARVEDIQNTLRECLTDPAMLAQVGAGGLAAAERYFSYRAVGKILNGLLARIRPAGGTSAPQKTG